MENSQVSEPQASSAGPELTTPRGRSVHNHAVGGEPSTVAEQHSRDRPGRTRNGAPDLATHQLHVALTWLRRGHPVIPCSRTDKGPLVPGFGRDATELDLAKFFDERQVTEWWTGKYRRAHVGILTRRLVVIDLDAPGPDSQPLTGRWAGCEHGLDVLESRMREAGGTWVDTYEVETPSAGKPVPGSHLYFEQPSDGPLIGCATGDGPTAPHIGPLVDVRGVGGLVIAAGSHSLAQGRPYTRISPAGLQPQPLPDWLLGILRRPDPAPVPRPAPLPVTLPTGSSRADRAASKALDHCVRELSAMAPETGRNARLFSAARWLGELSPTAPVVLSESAVRDQLLGAALACGLTERAALATIRSGWAKGTAGTLGGAA